MAKTKKKNPIKTNKKLTSNERLVVLQRILQNAASSRRLALEYLLNPNKNINYECGYPKALVMSDYKAMYDREGIGTRIVKLMPDESWAMLPKIEENQEVEETDFEKEWKDLEKEKHLFHYLHRIDVLSGIGRFGVLLLGINDGKKLWQPIKGINPVTGETAGKNKYELLYLRPFDESVVSIKTKEVDISSPRYGLPVTYSVSFENSISGTTSKESKVIHWTRVLHIVDNRETSEICGIPRMRPVYNRLLDLRKIVAGSGEMFWKGGFPGFALELDEGATLTDPDRTALKAQVKDYQDGLQRWLSLEGVKIKELKPQIEDPEPHIKVQLQYICATLGIPYRIFLGSEAAHLASTEDKETWNKRISERQENYISPMLIRLLIDRLIVLGIIPEVEEYFIEWPDLNAPGEKEVAEIAVKKTEALAKYIMGSVDEIFPPKEYFTMVMKISEEDADVIIKAAELYIKTSMDEGEGDSIKEEEEIVEEE